MAGPDQDPNIPRQDTARSKPSSTPMTFGEFVDYGSKVVLSGRGGMSWDLNRVSIITGSFGFTKEGMVKLPRPTLYAPGTQEVIIQGDAVCIFFIDGHPKRPVVMGGIRGITSDPDPNPFQPPLAYNHDSEGANPNHLFIRLVPSHPLTGIPNGLIEVSISEDDGASIDISLVNLVPPIPLAAITFGPPALVPGGPKLRTQAFLRIEDFFLALVPVLDEIVLAATAAGTSSVATAALKTAIQTGIAFRSTFMKGE